MIIASLQVAPRERRRERMALPGGERYRQAPTPSINLEEGPFRGLKTSRSAELGLVAPAGRQQREEVRIALARAQEAHADLLAHPVLRLQRNQADVGRQHGAHPSRQ